MARSVVAPEMSRRQDPTSTIPSGTAPTPESLPNVLNYGPQILGACTALTVIMILFVACRAWAKAKIVRQWTWDDVTCAIATVGVLASYVMIVMLVKGGLGTISSVVGLPTEQFLKLTFLNNSLSPPTLLFAKLSFYILYVQIFRLNHPLRWAIYLGAFLTTSFYATMAILQAVLLTPGPGKSYTSITIQKPAIPRLSYTLGIFGIISDLYILLLPVAGVLQLQLARRRKIGVVLVFLTGGLAFVCSCLLLYYRTALNHAGLALDESAARASLRHITPLTILTYVELAVGVSCSCMPAVSIVLRRCFPAYATVKARISAALHVSVASKDTKGAESLRNRGLNDDSTAGHAALEKPAVEHQSPEMEKKRRATKTFEDIEKQYPVEDDEAYLMDELNPCRSQHSTPVSTNDQDDIGYAC